MHEGVKSLLPEGLPAGWTFGRDLRCPQCKYNLRSLREPRCPECGFTFRWQQLLGVICPRCARPLKDENGNICSQCFLTLDWVQLFSGADPNQQLEFEYATRLARPYLHTLIETLNPWRFWNRRRVEFPPNRTRLRYFLYISAIVGVIGMSSPLIASILGWTFIRTNDWLAIIAFATTPSLVSVVFIRNFAKAEIARGRRPERPYRTYAYSIAGFVWSSVILALATLVAVVTNAAVAWSVNQRLTQPTAAISFNLDKALRYYLEGDVTWQWHPVDIWFSVGVTAMLLVFGLLWWPAFTAVSIRRGLGASRVVTFLTLASIAMISTVAIVTIWSHTIPQSELIQRISNAVLAG